MGDRLKSAYGEFCSRHNEAVQLYKDLMKSDVNFQAFIKVLLIYTEFVYTHQLLLLVGLVV